MVQGPDGFEAARAELAGLADDGELPPEELARRAGEDLPAGSTLVVVMPSDRCDLEALAERGAAPGAGRAWSCWTRPPSVPPRTGGSSSSPEQLEGWAGSPPPGFSFCLTFQER